MVPQPSKLANERAKNERAKNDLAKNDLAKNDRPTRRVILLVEDEPFVREATASILQNAGFEVLTAEDANRATSIYEQFARRIDLLMTDMVLPGQSGEELGQHLRQRSPQLTVLITSGYYGNPEYEKEFPADKTYFLMKPYSRRTLLDKIEAILGARPQARPATQAG